MRDFTGRELVKLTDVREGDTLEVRVGANSYLDGGTYTVERGSWGLCLKASDGKTIHYLDYMPQEIDNGEAYLSGVYHPETPVTQEPVAMSTTLSEDEMRDFFARMVSTIVGYSKQAEELKGVQAQIAELEDKFTRQSEYVIKLEAQNQNQQAEIHRLQGRIDSQSTEIHDLAAEHDLYVEQNANLHKEVDATNTQLKETIHQLEAAQEAVHIERGIVQDRDDEIERLKAQLNLVMEDRDATSALYSETRDKLAESERKLRGVEDAIRNVNESFSSLRAVS